MNYIDQRINYQCTRGNTNPQDRIQPKINEDSDTLLEQRWQKWQEAIQPMIDQISRSEIIT